MASWSEQGVSRRLDWTVPGISVRILQDWDQRKKESSFLRTLYFMTRLTRSFERVEIHTSLDLAYSRMNYNKVRDVV
jgi:hypothetical protein